MTAPSARHRTIQPPIRKIPIIASLTASEESAAVSVLGAPGGTEPFDLPSQKRQPRATGYTDAQSGNRAAVDPKSPIAVKEIRNAGLISPAA